jgi:hypothetical protein
MQPQDNVCGPMFRETGTVLDAAQHGDLYTNIVLCARISCSVELMSMVHIHMLAGQKPGSAIAGSFLWPPVGVVICGIVRTASITAVPPCCGLLTKGLTGRFIRFTHGTARRVPSRLLVRLCFA